jgi:hypothetical protein
MSTPRDDEDEDVIEPDCVCEGCGAGLSSNDVMADDADGNQYCATCTEGMVKAGMARRRTDNDA